MIKQSLLITALVCTMACTGSALAAAKAGTPGALQGASNADPASTPTCQGHGLGFLNKAIRPTITALQGKPGLGQFWQNPAAFPAMARALHSQLRRSSSLTKLQGFARQFSDFHRANRQG
jgi:hypothetical protein